MLAWLSVNLINIALVVFLAALIALILFGKRRARKAGKPSCACGCSCESCAGCPACCGCASRENMPEAGSSRA